MSTWWLDNTGRPISDQARITETFRRLDYDTMEWSETLEDPKIYTRPWQTMKIPMTLQDGRVDVLTRYLLAGGSRYLQQDLRRLRERQVTRALRSNRKTP